MAQPTDYMSYPEVVDAPAFIPPSVACFGKRYTKRWQAAVKQRSTYDYWRQLFFTAAMSRFEWEGLPPEIDARYLELMLLGYGSFAMTKRGDGAFMPYWAGRMTPQGQLDIYRNPNHIRIIAPNGYQQVRHANHWVSRKGSNGASKRAQLMPPDAVVCWDNLTRFPILQMIDRQAQRLADMDNVIDQHVKALRAPYIIAVDEEGRRNAEAMYNSIDSGQPAIYTAPNAMLNVPVQVLQTMSKSAYAGSDVLNDELKIVSAVYTMLGIDNNAAAEKRERVQTAETLANNEQFMIQRYSFQKTRDMFVEKCGEVFGLSDIRCQWAVHHLSETGTDVWPIVEGSQFLETQGEIESRTEG